MYENMVAVISFFMLVVVPVYSRLKTNGLALLLLLVQAQHHPNKKRNNPRLLITSVQIRRPASVSLLRILSRKNLFGSLHATVTPKTCIVILLEMLAMKS